MKNRIVYPQLWLDDKFADCSVSTKLLFMYLITNIQLGLSRYLHITDRQILFDTGLSANQLETGKKELTSLKWMFFTENWVYQNHKCSYVDYSGQERVMQAKDKEIASIPEHIKEYFKGLLSGQAVVSNPAITINHKQEIINHKSEIIKGKKEEKNIYSSLDYLKKIPNTEMEKLYDTYNASKVQIQTKATQLANYCEGHGKKYKNYKAMLLNALIKDFGYRKPTNKPFALPLPEEQTPEEKAKAEKKLEEIRAQWSKNKHSIGS